MTQITIGAPTIEVTALMGSDASYPGNLEIKLHPKVRAAPIRTTAGNKTPWFEVRKKVLAICGTAKPTKAIGPVNAVPSAIKKPDISINMLCSNLTLNPELIAYCWPNNKAFKGFTYTIVTTKTTNVTINIMRDCVMLVFEKLPSPQRINACKSSELLKN